MHRGAGDGAAAVDGTDCGGEFAQQRRADLLVVAALVHESPEDDRRVVDARLDHIDRLLDLEPAEFRVALDFDAVAPAERLLPDQKTELVAEVEKALALRIVAAADEVAAEIAQDLQVLDPEFVRHGRAELRMRVVAVVAAQAERLTVQQQFALFAADGAQAETLDDGIASGFQRDEVQIRAVRTPERGGGDLRFERELLPVENGIDLLRRGAVESGRNLREAAAERAGNQNAPRQVERFDPDPPEACFFRQSFELDRAVDAAVAVEVVEMVKEGGIREIEPVVDQDDEFMPGAAAESNSYS